jgi:hypothetical protein
VNDRAFRLDFFIAIVAVLVSALTAGTLIYQTRVIGDQFAATIWPYLSVGATYDINGETIEVTNDGLGPALVRSAQLKVDGTAVRAWNDYVRILATDPEVRRMFQRTRVAIASGKGNGAILTMRSIGPSSTLRPGETDTLLKIAFANSVPAQLMRKHSVSIDLCYCSLNASCWTLESTPGSISSVPRHVSGCTSSVAIESNFFTPPSTKSRAAAR